MFTHATAVAIESASAYVVTRDGRVLSYRKPDRRNGGTTVRLDLAPKALKPKDNGHGYLSVCLVTDAGARSYRYIHRLVAEAFIGPIPRGMEVRHINGTRSDNRLENLEIGTSSENEMDKWRHGTMMHGDDHANAKLTVAAVREAREMWATETKSLTEIKTILGLSISRSGLHNALVGKTWRHVPPAASA